MKCTECNTYPLAVQPQGLCIHCYSRTEEAQKGMQVYAEGGALHRKMLGLERGTL
jgi:hypothetical protein